MRKSELVLIKKSQSKQGRPRKEKKEDDIKRRKKKKSRIEHYTKLRAEKINYRK